MMTDEELKRHELAIARSARELAANVKDLHHIPAVADLCADISFIGDVFERAITEGRGVDVKHALITCMTLLGFDLLKVTTLARARAESRSHGN